MTAPIYVTHVAHSPMPRGHLLSRWRWEIRDGGPEGRLLAEGSAWRKARAIADREKARARCKRRYAHVQPRRPLTPAQREAGLVLINACMTSFAAGMHVADDQELRHEAERLEALPKSRVITTMRAIVDGERAARAKAPSHG